MEKNEFDQYAEQYNEILREAVPESLNEDSYFAEYKIALIKSLLKNKKTQRILDFGCGAGRSLSYLQKYFPQAELWGFDVSVASLKLAAEHFPNVTLFSDWQATESTYFDVILAANVFHHIPLSLRSPALKQCHESLAHHGQMFLFEHNPYNPLTRWVFERCPFDINAEMLSMRTAINLSLEVGFLTKRRGYTLFFPRQLAFMRGLESWLESIPLGAQYYVQLGK